MFKRIMRWRGREREGGRDRGKQMAKEREWGNIVQEGE